MVDLVMIHWHGTHTLPPGVKLLRPGSYPRWWGIAGSLDGLTFRLTEHGLTVRGSLPKFLRGNNIEPMTVSDIPLAFGKLGALLGFDIWEGVVRELEIGTAILVDCPSTWYTATWGLVSRFERRTFGNGGTVLYRTKPRSMQGYDKEEETRQNPQDLPEAYHGKHAIRLEYKLKNGIARWFGRPLLVSDLLDLEVVHGLMEEWSRFYFSIVKDPRTFVSVKGGKRELFNSLIAFGIRCLGGLEGIALDIRERPDLSADQRHEWMRDLQRISQDPAYTGTSELTNELDAKVVQALRACW